jgi:hypothetical protein
MNALILDASASPCDQSARAADALEAALQERAVRVTRVTLRDLDLRPCNGCFGCWTTRPGECLIDDDARRISAQVIASDVLVVAGPVRFGAWGSLAKSAIDRLIGLILPHFVSIRGEIHHGARYARYPRWISLGTMPRANAEAEAIFARLTSRNAVNFHCPSHAAAIAVGDADVLALARQLVESAGVAA